MTQAHVNRTVVRARVVRACGNQRSRSPSRGKWRRPDCRIQVARRGAKSWPTRRVAASQGSLGHTHSPPRGRPRSAQGRFGESLQACKGAAPPPASCAASTRRPCSCGGGGGSYPRRQRTQPPRSPISAQGPCRGRECPVTPACWGPGAAAQRDDSLIGPRGGVSAPPLRPGSASRFPPRAAPQRR